MVHWQRDLPQSLLVSAGLVHPSHRPRHRGQDAHRSSGCRVRVHHGGRKERRRRSVASQAAILILSYLHRGVPHEALQSARKVSSKSERKPLVAGLWPAAMALGSVLCVMAAKDTPHRILFRPFCALVPDGTMGTSPFALMWVKLWRVVNKKKERKKESVCVCTVLSNKSNINQCVCI